MQRAEHHASNVDEIVLALMGAVVWKKHPGTELEVRTHAGQLANVLWMTVGGTRYAFSYNHTVQAIELRRDSLKGTIVATFSNQTTTGDLKGVFDAL